MFTTESVYGLEGETALGAEEDAVVSSCVLTMWGSDCIEGAERRRLGATRKICHTPILPSRLRIGFHVMLARDPARWPFGQEVSLLKTNLTCDR